MIDNAKRIVNKFIESGYKHQPNIPNNRVFVSDITASTLAWWEDNVVIEYYMLFPNIPSPPIMHSHPFGNQIIFISGELRAYRTSPSGQIGRVTLKDEDRGWLSGPVFPPFKHGFITGSKGAVFYNIQIWPEQVENPTSASLVYEGPPLGPNHAITIQK